MFLSWIYFFVYAASVFSPTTISDNTFRSDEVKVGIPHGKTQGWMKVKTFYCYSSRHNNVIKCYLKMISIRQNYRFYSTFIIFVKNIAEINCGMWVTLLFRDSVETIIDVFCTQYVGILLFLSLLLDYFPNVLTISSKEGYLST